MTASTRRGRGRLFGTLAEQPTKLLVIYFEGSDMVSPASNWEDTENGLKNGDTRITVDKVEGEHWSEGKRTEFEGYSIIVWMGPSGYASPEEIATYKNPRPAWELAHILTRYFDKHSSKLDLSKLTNGSMEGENLPPNGIAEREPEQLVRDALGEYEFRLDEVLR